MSSNFRKSHIARMRCARRGFWATIFLAVTLAFPATAQTIDTRVGKLVFDSGYPTDETAKKLYDELDFQRAVQAYLWAMPMASYGAGADAMRAMGINNRTVLLQENSAEQQHLVLTGNQDTVYLGGVLDLREGPVVMELPQGLLGTLNNIWQEPLVDLGGPFSPEQSRGGRFLILPPGYDGPLPQFHHHVIKSDTNTVIFYLRAIGQSRDDWPALSDKMRTYRQYPLSEAANPPETGFISATGKEFDLLIKTGFAYFENLARYINDNPPRSQDMAMLGMIETLGIAHGRPFEPDERMRKILTEAAEVGLAMAKTVGWHSRTRKEKLYFAPEKRQWKWLFAVDNPWFRTPDYMQIDERTRFTYEAIGTAEAMVLAVPGQGSTYIGAYQDSKGRWLSGEHTYRVHLPKDMPAAMFWSLTLYDNETRSQIRNDLGRPLVGTIHGTQANQDGSYDLYFGPTPPDGVPKANWVQTRPGSGWFVYLRLYGPEKPFWDRTWVPGDAERVK